MLAKKFLQRKKRPSKSPPHLETILDSLPKNYHQKIKLSFTILELKYLLLQIIFYTLNVDRVSPTFEENSVNSMLFINLNVIHVYY